ncbi:hypothetical protein ACFU7Y_39145 [Kitasatospora sp. NPDC057542]|uniref:hypothetical protein n=1 Tax=Kitasatospora sp. NPDC057542 TaxID=3346162 RepID=UPI00369B901E
MSGTDLFGPHGPTDDGQDEEELRILLHQAVPALTSPDDRMERVLARVDRARRRRRVAGLAAGLTVGLTAAVLAAAPALAPAPVRGAGLGPAGSVSAPAPAVSAQPSPVLAPSSPPPPSGRPPGSTGTAIFFPLFPEMVVDTPANWHTLAAVTTDPQERFGYLGTQPLGAGPSCTADPARCPLSVRLPTGGAVLTFRLVDDQGPAAKLGASPPGLTGTEIDKDCAALGGSRSLTGLRSIDHGARAALVEMTACLRQPSEPTLRQVQQVFDSIRSAPAGSRSSGAVSPAAAP